MRREISLSPSVFSLFQTPIKEPIHELPVCVRDPASKDLTGSPHTAQVVQAHEAGTCRKTEQTKLICLVTGRIQYCGTLRVQVSGAAAFPATVSKMQKHSHFCICVYRFARERLNPTAPPLTCFAFCLRHCTQFISSSYLSCAGAVQCTRARAWWCGWAWAKGMGE